MVKMSESSPAVIPGEYITTSNESGKAMKATQTGFVIGKALESWSPGSGKDRVLVFVNNMWYDPNITINPSGNISIFADPLNPESYLAKDQNGENVTKDSTYNNLSAANVKAGGIDAQKITLNGIDILDILSNATSATD